MEEIYKNLSIVYSPDDSGYYAETRDGTWKASKAYKTFDSLIKAIDNGTIKLK